LRVADIDFMKIADSCLLLAGWLLVLSAVVLLPAGGERRLLC